MTDDRLIACMNKTMIIPEADTMLEQIASGMGVPLRVFCSDPTVSYSRAFMEAEQEKMLRKRYYFDKAVIQPLIDKWKEDILNPPVFVYLMPLGKKCFARRHYKAPKVKIIYQIHDETVYEVGR